MTPTPIELIALAIALRARGRTVYGCLVVDARGSTPQSSGAFMLIDDAAGLHGTVGGGCVEAEVRRRALEMIGRGERGRMTFKLDHDYGWDDGLICGGTLEIAVAPLPETSALEAIVAAIDRGDPAELVLELPQERCSLSLPPRPRLLIAGAGHVGQAVARLALPLGFAAVLFDDRADMLRKHAPEGVSTVDGEIAARLAATDVAGAYCVVVTRGHRHDLDALGAVIGRGAKYVGMIGSRRKVKLTLDDLAGRGATPEDLDAVFAPIGLDIGAVTVEEIALAIAAQLVAIRRGSSFDD